jgi:hypothetical protein
VILGKLKADAEAKLGDPVVRIRGNDLVDSRLAKSTTHSDDNFLSSCESAVCSNNEGVDISNRNVDSNFACHDTEQWSSDITSS